MRELLAVLLLIGCGGGVVGLPKAGDPCTRSDGQFCTATSLWACEEAASVWTWKEHDCNACSLTTAGVASCH